MKTLHLLTATLLCTLCFFQVHSEQEEESNKKEKKLIGDRYLESYSYLKAINFFEPKAKKGDPSVMRKLATSYRLVDSTQKAEYWYLKLIETGKSDDPSDLFHYANMLKANQKYAESSRWMKRYAKANPSDSRAQRQISAPAYYKELLKDKERFTLENQKVNSKYSDFGASFYGDDLLLITSSRNKPALEKRNYNWNETPWLDMYCVHPGETKSLKFVTFLDKVINTKYHDGPGVFSPDGETFYFTRSNFIDGEKKFNAKQVNSLQLLVSRETDKGWSEAEPMSFASDDFSTGHPSISADGNTIYFSSDMPGGFGGSDIYYSQKDVNGDWSKPVNMGKEVNTEGDEMFPQIHEKGVLFFASDGLPGLGGLDVFSYQIEKNQVKNLGAPLNSEKDDFSAIFDADLQYGYVASNRPGGVGDDDIYLVNVLKPMFEDNPTKQIIAVFKEKGSDKLMANQMVYLKSPLGAILDSALTNENGEANFFVKKNQLSEGLVTSVSANPESTISLDFSTADLSQDKIRKFVEVEGYQEEMLASVEDVEKIEEIPFNFTEDIKVIIEENKTTVMLPIAFDYNSSSISENSINVLEETYQFLLGHPDYDIIITAHTDCRGRADYNLKLSKKRADFIKDYLAKQGIQEWRMVTEGKGESDPLILCDCANGGQACNEEDHHENRRSELVLKKLSLDTNVRSAGLEDF